MDFSMKINNILAWYLFTAIAVSMLIPGVYGALVVAALSVWLSIYAGKKNSETFKPLTATLKFSLPISFIIILINTFALSGDTVILTVPFNFIIFKYYWKISVQALIFGFQMSVRIFTVMLLFETYSRLVDEDRIILGLIKKGSSSALTMALAARFYPFISNTMNDIYIAQSVRGCFSSESKSKRIQNYVYVFFPLVNSALQRAWGLSEILTVRMGAFKAKSQSDKLNRTSTDFYEYIIYGFALFTFLFTAIIPGFINDFFLWEIISFFSSVITLTAFFFLIIILDRRRSLLLKASRINTNKCIEIKETIDEILFADEKNHAGTGECS